MKRLVTATILLLCLIPPWLGLSAHTAPEASQFQPPEARSVTEFPIPLNDMASGTVVLDVRISPEGEVVNVQVRRDITGETEEAVRAAKTWIFEPAKLNGKAVKSRISIAVTFNPAPPLAEDIPLPPLIHQDDVARTQSAFQPPEVTRATFPAYPLAAFSPDTVILEANVNQVGRAVGAKTLRDAPPFTTAALSAIAGWRFLPATLNGKPIESKVILVFCFRQPVAP